MDSLQQKNEELREQVRLVEELKRNEQRMEAENKRLSEDRAKVRAHSTCGHSIWLSSISFLLCIVHRLHANCSGLCACVQALRELEEAKQTLTALAQRALSLEDEIDDIQDELAAPAMREAYLSYVRRTEQEWQEHAHRNPEAVQRRPDIYSGHSSWMWPLVESGLLRFTAGSPSNAEDAHENGCSSQCDASPHNVSLPIRPRKGSSP